MEILKSLKEKSEEHLKRINKIFEFKKFTLNEENCYICQSYMDKVDVKLAHRIEFHMRLNEQKLEFQFNRFKHNKEIMEFKIKGFKFYWNKINELLLYQDSKHPYWLEIQTKENEILLQKKGIDEVIAFVKLF